MFQRAAFATLAFVSLGAMTLCAQGPDPADVYVQSISYGGSGCPQGTVGQSISNDRTTLTLIFDSFVAAFGPAVPQTESRKNCQINVNLHVPNGFQYSILATDQRGYVQLPAGAQAEAQSIYYFSGGTQSRTRSVIRGPVAKDYLESDTVPLTGVTWSACNAVAPVNINTSVTVNRGSAASTAIGQMTADSVDGKVRTVFALAFRRC